MLHEFKPEQLERVMEAVYTHSGTKELYGYLEEQGYERSSAEAPTDYCFVDIWERQERVAIFVLMNKAVTCPDGHLSVAYRPNDKTPFEKYYGHDGFEVLDKIKEKI